ncbi:MAG: hypothetical protein HC784_16980 [Hydrococcus sp. CSU_1_8]|nr:hypothetical protein [Hydrococcus sp. CSU_1_8]
MYSFVNILNVSRIEYCRKSDRFNLLGTPILQQAYTPVNGKHSEAIAKFIEKLKIVTQKEKSS